MSDANRSEQIGELVGALAKARALFNPIKKTVENSAYANEKTGKKSYYADLAAIIDAVEIGMAENGLALIQTPIVDHENKMAGVESILAHSSGQWKSATLLLPATSRKATYETGTKTFVDKFDAQSIGIAITYSRRYSWQSMVGIAAEEDDDGNGISIEPGSNAAAQAVAKEKLNSRAGIESLEFKLDGAGMAHLHGLNGTAILRANLSPEQQHIMVHLKNAGLWAIPEEKVEEFFGIASKVGIKVSIGTGSPANGAAQTGSAKAVGTPAESAPTNLPIIKSALITGEGTKQRLVVHVSNGSVSNQYGCWKKHLWAALIAGVNQTCVLSTEANGKYQNIVDVAKIGDRSYENGKPVATMNDPAKGFTASDDDLPF